MNHFLLILTIIFSCHSLSFAQSGLDIPELEPVDNDIMNFMKKWNIPGGSAALVKDGRLVYDRAFGYADANINTQTFHLFRTASLSKPITSIAVMKLIQEGWLHMDDKIFGTNGILNDSVYLNISDPRVLKITLQHLLQHSGGWNRETSPSGDPMFDPVFIAQALNIPPPADKINIIRYILSKSLDFTPGTTYAYSNFGYNILGRVIEKITGKPYDEYVKKNILYPLEIFDLQQGKNYYQDKHENEVQYYLDPGNSPLMLSSDQKNGWNPSACGDFNIEAMDAHGGWIASASSLAKLLTAVDGYDTKPDILSADIVSLMSAPSQTNASYANGWFVNPQGNWWHTGSLPGSSAMLARLNNGIIWVILFNKRADDANYFNELDQLMWSALNKIKTWPDHDLFSSVQTVMPDPTSDQIKVFPNPALYFSTIAFRLREASQVNISIINQQGIKTETIANAVFPEGEHEFVWDCKNQNRGLYICKIQIGNTIHYKKIILK